MAIERSAVAVWNGTLREGSGVLSTDSKILSETPYTFVSRFETGNATNPEELIAAAHAGCYSMALGAALGKKGFTVHHIATTATVVLGPKPAGGGSMITLIRLTTRGKVEGVDAETFKQMAEETKQGCIISQALSAVPMEIDSALE